MSQVIFDEDQKADDVSDESMAATCSKCSVLRKNAIVGCGAS